MHRTEGTDHAANLFNNGPPGTVVEQNWLNAVQEEIAYVIEQAGLVLKTASTETRQQLKQAILVFIANMISNDAYGAGWDGVDTIAPSKNAVYDKIANMISNDVYGAGWDGIETIAPSKNAVYDQIASMIKTEHRIPVFGAGVIAELAAMTNGQLAIGVTGAAPIVAALTQGSGITITNAAGSVTISLATGIAKIKTGTYTGNGSTSQAITGIGFTVKYVKIWQHLTSAEALVIYEKVDQSWGTWAQVHSHTAGSEHLSVDDRIIALGADGFTVDDAGIDTQPNKDGEVYDYLALGGT